MGASESRRCASTLATASTGSDFRKTFDQKGWAEAFASGDAPHTSILVTRSGQIVIMHDPPAMVDGQLLIDSVDLRRPRPKLRIHPGRISGEPHLKGSRLTTRAIAGLLDRGLPQDMVEELYPMDDPEGIAQTVDLFPEPILDTAETRVDRGHSDSAGESHIFEIK
ncbi:MAG: DUF433 domain-containing protein [Euzebya sp.]